MYDFVDPVFFSRLQKIKVEKFSPTKGAVKQEMTSPTKGGRKKKEEQQEEVWKWYVVHVFNFSRIKLK